MCYGEYLKRGYPIASGVIEGACRYVVKDRLERTGMTWVRQGEKASHNLIPGSSSLRRGTSGGCCGGWQGAC